MPFFKLRGTSYYSICDSERLSPEIHTGDTVEAEPSLEKINSLYCILGCRGNAEASEQVRQLQFAS
jgi:hypothetical protein